MRKHFLLCSILGLCTLPTRSLDTAPSLREEQNAQSNGSTQQDKSAHTKDPAPDFASALIPQWTKVQRTLVRDGISLRLEVDPREEQSQAKLPNASHFLRVRLALQDAATHSPLTGLHPSAWLSLRENNEGIPCSARARAFLRRGLMEKQPDLDLTDYYVLVLNQDETIHVVDPQFSSGQSRLIASIALPARADDWLLSADQSRLYVSMSKTGEVAMIDTATWTITHRAKVAGASKLALQPDEHYLWSSYSGSESGVAVLSTADLHLVKQIPLHTGKHDIAFSDNSQLAFVTNPGASSVSAIDVAHLTQIKEVKTPGPASSIAYSSASQSAYATTFSGNILAINTQGAITAHIEAEPGLTRISFFRDGRFGFVLNPGKGLVHLLDAARNALIQTAQIDAAPEQVAYSDQMAYIIRRESDLVEVVPLDSPPSERAIISTVDLPAGHGAFSNASADELTTAMVQAPGENAVMFANAGDKAIFYYEEGMAAPMGTFSNFGKEPRSVLVVDHSFKEKSPGLYEASGLLNKPGTYVVPVLLDSPRMVECFEVPLGVEPSSSGDTGHR
jgi:DNA-binding beta-propeller fold protein YncE